MTKIKLNDYWVRKQLTEKFTLHERLRYQIRDILSFLLKTGVPIPSVSAISMSMFNTLLTKAIKKSIKEGNLFPSHSKILESRGMSSLAVNLRTIIDRLPNYQALIYSTDEFYRDHIEHQIRVAVLGNFLLSQQFDFDNETTRLMEVILSQMDLSEQDVRKAWWIAGLFHDTGIPVAKLTRNLTNMIKSDLGGAYEKLNLKILDIENPIPDKDENEVFFDVLVKGLTRSIKNKLRRALGWGRNARADHGVISALLLLKSIPSITTLSVNEVENHLENEYRLYLTAAKAMMLHNLYKDHNYVEIDSRENPLAYLLVFCDEMQEWERDVNVKEGLFDPAYGKVQLAKYSLLEISDMEISFSTNFNVQEAKDKCGFLFDKYVSEKRKNLRRLKNTSNTFPRISLMLTDFVFEGEKLIRRVPEQIPVGIS